MSVEAVDEPVMSAGSLVVSAYACRPRITKTIILNLKSVCEGLALYVDLSG